MLALAAVTARQRALEKSDRFFSWFAEHAEELAKAAEQRSSRRLAQQLLTCAFGLAFGADGRYPRRPPCCWHLLASSRAALCLAFHELFDSLPHRVTRSALAAAKRTFSRVAVAFSVPRGRDIVHMCVVCAGAAPGLVPRAWRSQTLERTEATRGSYFRLRRSGYVS